MEVHKEWKKTQIKSFVFDIIFYIFQLPRFFQLCSDNVWGVRKACAECFMAVSCATSQEVRRTKLSTLFINLISDPSRWASSIIKYTFYLFKISISLFVHLFWEQIIWLKVQLTWGWVMYKENYSILYPLLFWNQWFAL